MPYSLLHHNTFGIEASCTQFVEYASVQQLKEAIAHLGEAAWMHIGAGSNLLFVHDFDGVIFHSKIVGKEVLAETADELLLRVGAGEVFDALVAYCIERGYHGLENLSLIPGEVGAGAVQNVGAYGVEAGDCIERVETVEVASGKERVFSHDECQYAYRSSFFKHEGAHRFAVTHVVFRLCKHFTPVLTHKAVIHALEAMGVHCAEETTAQQTRDAIIQVRRSKLPDPSEVGSAGSFFMNPVVTTEKLAELLNLYPDMPHYDLSQGAKIPAAWLIEQCGWKGRRMGGAGVHALQPLVLINVDHATGEEVAKLAEAIRADVETKFGIRISPEVLYV